jgi:hypothetical protein
MLREYSKYSKRYIEYNNGIIKLDNCIKQYIYIIYLLWKIFMLESYIKYHTWAKTIRVKQLYT